MIVWQQFAQYFEMAALEHPEPFDLEELRAGVASGKFLTVGVFDGEGMLAGALCELTETRQGRSLHVRYLAGNHMEMWLEEMQARLAEIARAYDCRWLSLTGRLGWRKRLAKMGWNPVALQMRVGV